MKLSLKEVTDPRFELELPDGTVKGYDPYEIAERIEKLTLDANKANQGNGVTLSQQSDIVRQAYQLPTQAEVDAAPDPKPFTLSRHQCQHVPTRMMAMLEELDAKKKP